MSDILTAAAGVYTFLDASTAHINEQDAAALADNFGDDDFHTPRVIDHRYGWWLNVRDRDDDTDLFLAAHPNFAPLYDYALEHECRWINLDCDAETIPGLPTFDW